MPFDSLKVSVLDADNLYHISTHCNVDGGSWWVQLLVALIGAAIGGIAAGIVTYRMGKTNAEELLKREKKRDERQTIWNLLQDLVEFSTRILEADKYAGTILQFDMLLSRKQDSVNYFGSLVDKIEFAYYQKSFLLNDDLAELIRKIFSLMNQYKLVAMECTLAAVPANSMYEPSHAKRSETVNKCTEQCGLIRSQWNSLIQDLNKRMKEMKQEML